MLGLYTTTNAVAVVADVPVTGIEIVIDDGDVNYDMNEIDFDKGDVLKLDIKVMPQGATNKGVSFIFKDSTTRQEVDAFDVNMQGQYAILTPKIPGKFDIYVVTDDGGYRAYGIVYVQTNRVTAIDATVERTELIVGEIASIDATTTPVKPNPQFNYVIKSGEDVVKLVNGNKIKAIGLGTAVIEVSSAENPDATDEITVTVGSSGVFDYVDTEDYLISKGTEGTEGSVDIVVNPEIEIESWSAVLTDPEGVLDPNEILQVFFNTETGDLDYEFLNTEFFGQIDVALTLTPVGGEPVTKSCSVIRMADVIIDWADEDSSLRSQPVCYGEFIKLFTDVKPAATEVTYIVTVSYKTGTDLLGNVNSEEQIELIEGKKYTCNGGYISFTVVDNIFIIEGEISVGELDLIGKTETTLKIVARDEITGKTVSLGTKRITVVPQ